MASTAITGIDDVLRKDQLLAAFQQTLRRRASLTSLGNRANEASIRSGNRIVLPQDTSVYAAASVAATGTPASLTYPAASAFSGDGVVLDFEQTFVATPKTLTERQARSMTPAALVQMADQMTKAAVDTIQTYIATKLRDLTLGTVDQDLSATTKSVGQTSAIGTSSRYLQNDGTINGDPDDPKVFDGISGLLLKMESDNKLGEGAMDPLRPVIAMHPTVLHQLRLYLSTRGGTGVYLEEKVDGATRRTFFGYELVISSALTKFNTSVTSGITLGDYVTTGGKSAWPVYVMVVAEAAHYADLVHEPVIFEPSNNQTGRFYQVNMTGDYMFTVSDIRYIYRGAVRAEA